MRKFLSILLFISLPLITLPYYTAYAGLENGDVVLSKRADKKRAVASLAKLMTAIVVLDAVDKKEITLNDLVRINESVNVGESSVPLNGGDRISVYDLLASTLIYSANNSATALAIYVSGDVRSFVKRMNEKAKEFGMKDTMYYTPTGLPTSNTHKRLDTSTAKDQYILAKKALEDKRIITITNQKYVNIKGRYYKSRNQILGKNGNFGLKTGFHLSAGFNMIGTYKINNMDLIVVTMGDLSLKARFDSQLKISGNYKKMMKKIHDKESIFSTIPVKESKEKNINTQLEKDFYYHKSNIKEEVEMKDLKGAIKKGDKVGVLKIYNENKKLITTINILAMTGATNLSPWDKIKGLF
ncbi:D-alanyl-D-alanine carboxypeptidase family protein [Oceanivirga miroungae]|uniref:serine-type D-Ala-D-Ala carboxypeptidase n=1 Tax=Oceanivirga miroungae TaxID=1130046 RepID=A0A6I8MF65_9FUSO|nr:serine hydrolase [Oceanivirga miroungae]VWL85924.1 serine-type D-Ala-D-Ala carboxypeptidase [Oceanivirga miroungae]